jgi:predicted Zn-dependent protease
MDYLSVSTNEKQSITNEITKENQEISDLCRVLKENNQKLKTIAFEWQRFGQYTAALLQNEVLVFESKIKILTVSVKLRECTLY